MKYIELKEGIGRYEKEFWFGDYLYLGTLKELNTIRSDIKGLTKDLVVQVIKVFLSQWGHMTRTVNRKDIHWGNLTSILHYNSDIFNRIRDKSFLDISAHDNQLSSDIMHIYESIKIQYIGSTAKSKILHLLNPELFVMWDDAIRKGRFKGDALSYLEFLKKTERDIKEACDEVNITTKEEAVDRILREISFKIGKDLPLKTLAKLADEYNQSKAYR